MNTCPDHLEIRNKRAPNEITGLSQRVQIIDTNMSQPKKNQDRTEL